MSIIHAAKLQPIRTVSVVVIGAVMMFANSAWAVNQVPLSRVAVPVPRSNGELALPQYSGPNGLAAFVKDVPTAVALGKALFWDMQVGSDGVQACASCHYGAGADPIDKFRLTRSRNRINPGPDSIFGNNTTTVKTFSTNLATGVTSPVDLRATGNPRFAPNYALQPIDFPLFSSQPVSARLLLDPLTGRTGDEVSFLFDTNDVIGSPGIRLADFLAINNTALDNGTPLVDQVFNTGPTPNGDPLNNTRQVTRRNAPSVINAVFNYANLWDGRANNIFNGETPYGPLDQNAGIWLDDGFALVKQKIAIPNSSLASQAVSPPVDDTMMSFKGRTFPELGKKILSLSTPPLGQQLVHTNDSVLGGLSRATLQPDGSLAGNRGLDADYTQMIRAAFQEGLWSSSNRVTLPTRAAPAGEQFSQMEANFSLFWGLAIQLYEATLVSDQTPFDRYQAGNRNSLSPDLLNAPGIPSAVRGFGLFDGKCTVCHSGSELTSAAVGSNQPLCATPDCNRPVFNNNTTHQLIQQNLNLETFDAGLIDSGYFNIGVRDTADDIGRGALSPAGYPLAFAALALLQEQGKLPFATPGLGLLLPSTPVKVNGAFKTPGLRNIELTAPYFHNGDSFSLDEVVDFYTKGGNFPNNHELASAMQPIRNLRGLPDKKADLVEFLKALTDERVRNETAPFDHPELIISDGVDESGAEILLSLTATGGAPAAVQPALVMSSPILPLAPTTLTGLLLSGTVDPTATVEIRVNAFPQVYATVTGSTWAGSITSLPVGNNSITVTAATPTGRFETIAFPLTVLPVATIGGVPSGGRTSLDIATLTIRGAGVVTYKYSLDNGAFSVDTPVAAPIVLTGLSDGAHTVTVLGRDATGNQQPLTSPTAATWTVKASPPVLTLNAVTTPARPVLQTISGTVELGSVPTVTVNTSAKAGVVRTIGGNGFSIWNCVITGLVPGTNTITVKALDFVFNLTTRSAAIEVVFPDGNFKGTGVTDVSDALKALRITVGLDLPTENDILHGDVSPFVTGAAPDNVITVADALLILKKVVGLLNF
jgi:cytochrome c peroxidase